MLSIVAKQDINLESQRIAAGREIATVSTVIPAGTLVSLMSQSHLVHVDERPSNIDPKNPFDLDMAACAAALSDDEATELLKHLADRLDIDAIDASETDDPTDPVTIDDATPLADVFAAAPEIKVDAAASYAAIGITTVGQLRAYLQTDGHELDTPAGIGKPTAAKIAAIPGLLN